MQATPLVILCGFLGSGKTTLLRRWRRDESLRDAAMIVHDLSNFGLDAELITHEEDKPVSGKLTGRVAALHGSHAREQLHLSAGEAFKAIQKLSPPAPLVLCESTGAARPWPLIAAMTQNPQFRLRHFIVTVDALNLHRDFADGRALIEQELLPNDPALKYAASILAEQLAFASIIILTKVDTIPKATHDSQVANLQKIQPHAAIGLSAQAGLLLNQLDGVPAPSLTTLEDRAKKLGLDQSDATADQVDATIFRDPRPFHPERLYQACQTKLGTGLYRAKGFLWLASRAAHVLLWQQSGSQIALELTGLWRAEIANNPDKKLLPEEIKQLKQQVASLHPKFGDRHNELTLIGLPEARNAFESALDQALCTEEEIRHWENGGNFPDPWPKKLRKVE